MTTSIKHWIIAAAAVLAGSVNVGCYGPDKELEGQLPRVLKLSGDTTLDSESRADAAFSPGFGLADVTRIAVDRWIVATGLDIEIGTQGVPIQLVPLLFADDLVNLHFERDAEGQWKEKCGVFQNVEQHIYVSESDNCVGNIESTVTHEIGHALGSPHQPGGVMRDRTYPGAPIDEDAVTAVCTVQACPSFNPEEICSNGPEKPATNCQTP